MTTSSQTTGKVSGTGGGPAVAAADREADAGSPSDVTSRSHEDGLCPGCGDVGRPDRDPPAADSLPGRSICQACRSHSGGRDEDGVGAGTETGAGASDGDGDGDGHGHGDGGGDVPRVMTGTFERSQLFRQALTLFHAT